MEGPLVLLVSIFVTLGVIFLSMPIAFGLALGGIVGIIMIDGFDGLNILSTIIFRHSFSFTLLAVPLFVFMGSLMYRNGLGDKLYDSSYTLIGHVSGGLGMTNILMNALFGFMCGSSTAAIASIGRIALSAMEKKGYNRKFSLGTTAGAGGLAILIPPSVVMVIYASVSFASLGKLFIAGILPGFLVAGLMAVYVFGHAKINRRLAPPGAASTWGERFRALPGVLPVALSFLTIVGGIYFGVWNAIEAGSAGSILAFLLCLAYKKFSFAKLTESLLETIHTTTMIFAIVIGANILTYVFHLTGVSKYIEDMANALNLPGWGLIFFIGIIMMILGMILDVVGLCLICVPIFLPAVEKAGFDPIWFGIFFVISAEMALLTPPVGVNLYVIYSIAPEGTTLREAVEGIIPFVCIFWVALIIITFAPWIVNWLPTTMIGSG